MVILRRTWRRRRRRRDCWILYCCCSCGFGFLSFYSGRKQASWILHCCCCCCGGGFGFSLWKKRSSEFCSNCCCCCGSGFGFSLWKKRSSEFCSNCCSCCVVVVVLGFWVFTLEEKESRILFYRCCCCCCAGFWVFHCGRKELQNSGLLLLLWWWWWCFWVFSFHCCTRIPSPPLFPFWFQFSGSCWVEGFFFCACKCLLHSISSSSFCVFVVWVSGFAEQHSLHLLPTFVSHLFIHSFIEGRVSLFMKQGIQCLCPSSLSFSLEDNNTFADEFWWVFNWTKDNHHSLSWASRSFDLLV